MGSDFPVGEVDPVGFLKRCKNVDDRAFAQISGETACSILGIASDDRRHSGWMPAALMMAP